MTIIQMAGKVYITDKRIVFKAGTFKFDTDRFDILYSEIAAVDPAIVLMGFIPMPTAIRIKTKGGDKYKVIIGSSRKKYLALLQSKI